MEETEHALYNRVRAAEMQRRKQEQDVQRLIGEMESLTKENEKRMKVSRRAVFSYSFYKRNLYYYNKFSLNWSKESQNSISKLN